MHGPTAGQKKRRQNGANFHLASFRKRIAGPKPALPEGSQQSAPVSATWNRNDSAQALIVVAWHHSPQRGWPRRRWKERCRIIVSSVSSSTHTHEHTFVAVILRLPVEWSDHHLAARRNASGNDERQSGHGLQVIRPDQPCGWTAVIAAYDYPKRWLCSAVLDAHVSVVGPVYDRRLMFHLTVRLMPVPDVGGFPKPLQIRELTCRPVRIFTVPPVVDIHINRWWSSNQVIRSRRPERLKQSLLFERPADHFPISSAYLVFAGPTAEISAHYVSRVNRRVRGIGGGG